jgi:tetratricopeptide (TPR) repeat protein
MREIKEIIGTIATVVIGMVALVARYFMQSQWLPILPADIHTSPEKSKEEIQALEKKVTLTIAEKALRYNDLGVAHYKQKAYDHAQNCCEKAVAKQRSLQVPNDLTLAIYLNNLSVVYVGQRKIEAAKDCLEEALRIRKHCFKKGSSIIENTKKELERVQRRERAPELRSAVAMLGSQRAGQARTQLP